jgi:hypothetical protein
MNMESREMKNDNVREVAKDLCAYDAFLPLLRMTSLSGPNRPSAA